MNVNILSFINLNPFVSNRAIICPTRCLATASGFTMNNVCSVNLIQKLFLDNSALLVFFSPLEGSWISLQY